MANTYDSELETPDMESLASLAENIVYRIPGCDDLMVRKVIQEIYRDFCRRSCCLNGRRHFVLDTEVRPLIVQPVYGGIVDSVSEVLIDGRMIDKFGYRSDVGGRLFIDIRYWPTSTVEEECLPHVDVMFVEIPKLNSEQAPSWFVQNYGEAITSGVLMRLMGMTGKAWSDASESQLNRIAYENAINEARMRFYSRNTSGAYGTVCNADEIL